MFSGIIEEIARVSQLKLQGDSATLSVESVLDHGATDIGDSIAVNGVCLTVVSHDKGVLNFELSAETLRCSTLGSLAQGAAVNLERALRVGDKISGHFVFGHVDGTLSLIACEMKSDFCVMRWALPKELPELIQPKGSISINGVSLTVGEVSDDWFSVFIVPHTAKATNLTLLRPGDRVNFEFDMLARYVQGVLARGPTKKESVITTNFLKRHGFTE